MAISVGEAIGEGFSVIRRAPGAVILWGAAQFLYALAIVALFAPLYLAIFHAVQAAGAGGAGSDASVQALTQQTSQFQGISYLIDVLQFGIYAVIYCAVFRAVLHPERSQWGYMRLSMPELLVGALMFGGYFVFAIIFVFAAIVVGIIIGILVAVHVIWAAVLIGVAAGVAALGALVYFALRVSLVAPMIVDEGRIQLTEAWRLTRGQVAPLFLIGLVLVLIALAAEIVIGLLVVALGLGAVAVLAGGPSHAQALFQQPLPSLLARLSPALVLLAAIWIPFIGGMSAVMGAPWARAYRSLKPPDVAATFA